MELENVSPMWFELGCSLIVGPTSTSDGVTCLDLLDKVVRNVAVELLRHAVA